MSLEDHDPDRLVDLYELMVRIRAFERAVDALSEDGETPGNPHLCIGQEAVAAGVCGVLDADDYVGSTWRGHGHLLAKGVDDAAMLAEIAGSRDGVNGGRAGTMHMADLSVGAVGQNGIVGASASHVAGAALSATVDGEDRVGVAFFSDGALNEGIVPETMNLAAIWDLPVVFVCENNQYAVSTPVEYSVANAENVPARAEAMGMPGRTIDGQDVVAVAEAAQEAVDHARGGDGPAFIEARTYRYSGHFAAEDDLLGDRSYRPDDEVSEWEARDPVGSFRDRLVEAGVAAAGELEDIETAVADDIDSARVRAAEGEHPPASAALAGVYADQDYETLPSEGYR